MNFIGDVHGKFNLYKKVISNLPESIQLGDMGIGFGIDHLFPNNPPHMFIRGNHDNPSLCNKLESHLGDFGIYKDIFYFAGACSIDKARRTIGLDWWEDEELNYTQMTELVKLYESVKPSIVCSHEAPKCVFPEFRANSTSNCMDYLIDLHKPDIWVFGHHHKSFDFKHNDIRFVGLNELEVFSL